MSERGSVYFAAKFIMSEKLVLGHSTIGIQVKIATYSDLRLSMHICFILS